MEAEGKAAALLARAAAAEQRARVCEAAATESGARLAAQGLGFQAALAAARREAAAEQRLREQAAAAAAGQLTAAQGAPGPAGLTFAWRGCPTECCGGKFAIQGMSCGAFLMKNCFTILRSSMQTMSNTVAAADSLPCMRAWLPHCRARV